MGFLLEWFLECDMARIAGRPGVENAGDCLTTRFLKQAVQIRKAGG